MPGLFKTNYWSHFSDGGAEKKTVLVWIHGGAFTEGSGDHMFYGPDFLIDPDNVLVTINYR